MKCTILMVLSDVSKILRIKLTSSCMELTLQESNGSQRARLNTSKKRSVPIFVLTVFLEENLGGRVLIDSEAF
jgi:hypothetical protein